MTAPALDPDTADRPTIRRGRDADGAGIAALVASVFAEYEGCLYDPAEFPELEAPATWYETKKGGRLWVAETGGRIVGSFVVVPTPDPATAEFFKVYLARDARGRGTAGRLMALGFEHARAMGAVRVRLWTDTRFIAGHRFYEKAGFTRLPPVRFLADVSASWEYCYLAALGAGA